jgi:hypothetical protein
MLRKFGISLIVCILAGASQIVVGQSRVVAEDELGMEVLKWHYTRYPKSIVSKWTVEEKGGTRFFEGVFNFGGYETVAVYNERGVIVEERIEMENNVPVSLVHYLDDIYSKYKITSFLRKEDFVKSEVKYQMALKSKEKGEEMIEFDKNLIPFESNLVSGSN